MLRAPALRLVLLSSATLGALAAEATWTIGDPAASPFAGKPAQSYSAFTTADGTPGVLRWGDAPFQDFGSRAVAMDLRGLREIPQAPAPGVHPRILFGPAQLPDIRQRLQATRCGQEAW